MLATNSVSTLVSAVSLSFGNAVQPAKVKVPVIALYRAAVQAPSLSTRNIIARTSLNVGIPSAQSAIRSSRI